LTAFLIIALSLAATGYAFQGPEFALFFPALFLALAYPVQLITDTLFDGHLRGSARQGSRFAGYLVIYAGKIALAVLYSALLLIQIRAGAAIGGFG
jgi:hypothetical protein